MHYIACGTIAVLHSIGNLEKELFKNVIEPDSYLDKFFKSTKLPITESVANTTACVKMTPDKIAQLLRDDHELDGLHAEASNLGQSVVPDEDEPMMNHFICFR